MPWCLYSAGTLVTLDPEDRDLVSCSDLPEEPEYRDPKLTPALRPPRPEPAPAHPGYSCGTPAE